MAEAKRITPEEVIEAYHKTGLNPIQGQFFGEGCACGFGAYSVANFGPEEVAKRHIALTEGRRQFGFDYRWGFTDGFDDIRAENPEDERYAAGYEDGQAAWAAVSFAQKEAARG